MVSPPHSRDHDDDRGNKLWPPPLPTPGYLQANVKLVYVDYGAPEKNDRAIYHSVGVEVRDHG